MFICRTKLYMTRFHKLQSAMIVVRLELVKTLLFLVYLEFVDGLAPTWKNEVVVSSRTYCAQRKRNYYAKASLRRRIHRVGTRCLPELMLIEIHVTMWCNRTKWVNWLLELHRLYTLLYRHCQRCVTFSTITHTTGARITKAYDVTIQRYRKSHTKIVSEMHILRCTGSKFCVKFQRCPLKFPTKCWTHTPQNMTNCDILQLWHCNF